MVAKYRVSLTETDIAALAGYCMEAKDYKRYVLLNTQLEKINGGIRQPDYAAAGVRAAAASNVMQTANTAFTIQDDNYIPGTTIKGNATIREKFTLMGHTRLTWSEAAILFLELAMDSTTSDRDKMFFEQLQGHAQHISTRRGNEQCIVFDLNEQQTSEDFPSKYIEEISKYGIKVILEGSSVVGTQVSIDTEAVPANTVVDVLNKFGL